MWVRVRRCGGVEESVKTARGRRSKGCKQLRESENEDEQGGMEKDGIQMEGNAVTDGGGGGYRWRGRTWREGE